MDLTFLIPVKLETEDRVRNLTTIISYLVSNFDAKILLKEVDSQPKFEDLIVGRLKTKFKKIPDNIDYTFDRQKKGFFHKTKILNDLIEKSTTEVVANWDTDAILPISSVNKAYEMIKSGESDAVYPYGCGIFQRAVEYNSQVYKRFCLASNLDQKAIQILDENSRVENSTVGWCQFIRRSNYIDSFMMNEEFAAWGPEDCELHYRLQALGNKVDRIDDLIYHLDHTRSTDSWFSNPFWKENTDLWNRIRTLSKDDIIKYYSTLEYVKRRNNAGI